MSIRVRKTEPEVITLAGDTEPQRTPPPWNLGMGAGDDDESEVERLAHEAETTSYPRLNASLVTQGQINDTIKQLQRSGWNKGATVVKLVTKQPILERAFFNPAMWGVIYNHRHYLPAGETIYAPLYVHWFAAERKDSWENPMDLFLIAPTPVDDVLQQRIRTALKS